MLTQWIMLELQYHWSISFASHSRAPDWWAKMENKASKSPRSLGRDQGLSSENPECQTALSAAPRGENRLVSWAQIPSGALEEGSVWRRVRDCRSHSKDGAEPAGTGGFQEPGSTGLKEPHVFRGAPFCFAFCLSGGDLFSQGRSPPETPALLRHTDQMQ